MMRRVLLGMLAGFAAFLSAPVMAKITPDWTQSVAATPEGGYRIGNPAAKVKLVEYASLTCPHCRHFAADGWPGIKSRYIASGRLSLEYRQFALNPQDMAAGMIMRCARPPAAWRFAESVYRDQDAVFAVIPDDAQQERLAALPPEKFPGALAAMIGLDRYAAAHGFPAAKVKACLADMRVRDRIVAIRKDAADRLDVQGTPTFVLDGKVLTGVFTWDALEPILAAAIPQAAGLP